MAYGATTAVREASSSPKRWRTKLSKMEWSSPLQSTGLPAPLASAMRKAPGACSRTISSRARRLFGLRCLLRSPRSIMRRCTALRLPAPLHLIRTTAAQHAHAANDGYRKPATERGTLGTYDQELKLLSRE